MNTRYELSVDDDADADANVAAAVATAAYDDETDHSNWLNRG